jgi:hypothetical protein
VKAVKAVIFYSSYSTHSNVLWWFSKGGKERGVEGLVEAERDIPAFTAFTALDGRPAVGWSLT